jgi:hypothetical protein
MIALAFPVFTVDHRGRRVVTMTIPCEQCLGSVASCCDAAGSAQPEAEKPDDD